MTAAVLPNFDKPEAVKTARKVCDILHNMGMEIITDERFSDNCKKPGYAVLTDADSAVKNANVVIVIGGDGTILEHSSVAARYKKALLGINVGRLGFMASMETDELYELSKLVSGDYVTEERMMLDGTLVSANGQTEKYTALNDICISEPYGRLTDFEISISEHTVSTIRADGLIFAAPTGSTAYSLSAGGPISEPTLECIEMTPLCPQSLSSRTILFSPKHELLVTHGASGEKVHVTVDGRDMGKFTREDKLIVSRSEKTLKLIDINGFSFFDAVNNKLMRSIK